MERYIDFETNCEMFPSALKSFYKMSFSVGIHWKKPISNVMVLGYAKNAIVALNIKEDCCVTS